MAPAAFSWCQEEGCPVGDLVFLDGALQVQPPVVIPELPLLSRGDLDIERQECFVSDVLEFLPNVEGIRMGVREGRDCDLTCLDSLTNFSCSCRSGHTKILSADLPQCRYWIYNVLVNPKQHEYCISV